MVLGDPRTTSRWRRTAAPLFRSTLGGNSSAPRALHGHCRRRSLTSAVRPLKASPVKLRRAQNWSLAVVALVAFYLGSFVLNSYCGGYWSELERDGHDRWSFGLSMPTAVLWQPRFGYWAPYRSDWLGTLYSPLIRLDRHLAHPTRYASAPDFHPWVNALPAEEVHPRYRQEFLAAKAKQQ